MRNFWVLLVFVFFSVDFIAQESPDNRSNLDRYLEDQFYIGLGFNFLLEKPNNVVQRNLSYNLQTGFIKDLPLNKRRNFGLGLGLGYAANSYYTNMVAMESGNEITYEISSDQELDRSKFETHTIEFPFELRWRTSTVDEYKFWRVYAGAKLGYVFSGRSKLVGDQGVTGFSNKDIRRLQYGLMMSFGYNTWNLRAYYSLNPLLEDGINLENGDPIEIRPLRIGVIFYIL